MLATATAVMQKQNMAQRAAAVMLTPKPLKLRPPKQITVVRTESEAHAFRLLLEQQPLTAVDTETTSKDARAAEVVVWSASWSLDSRALIYGNLLPLFAPWFANPAKKKVFHNLNYDKRVLENRHQKLVIRGVEGDSMVMDFYRDENSFHGLKEITGLLLGYHGMREYKEVFGYIPEGKKQAKLYDLRDVLAGKTPVSRETLYDYATKDSWATYGCFTVLRDLLQRMGLWDYYRQIEVPFALLLMEMEDAGITIDPKYIETVVRLARRRKAMLMRRIRQRAVEETGNAKWMICNPRSPKFKELIFDDLDWPAYGVTDSGLPRFDKDDLEDYIDAGMQLAILIKEWKTLATTDSNFLVPIQQSLALAPRVTTSFNQIGAVTGRQSSRRMKVLDEETGKLVKAGLNLQNIPSKEDKDPFKIRKAFVAAPGKVILAADYSQGELRVQAHLSGDKVMLDAYNHKPEKDLHIITGVQIAKVQGVKGIEVPDWSNAADLKTWKEGQKKHFRSDLAKPTNFGIAYGMSAFTLALRLGVDEDTAQEILDGWFDLYSGVHAWVRRTIAFAKKHGVVFTIAGRPRRVPDAMLSAEGIRDREEWKRVKRAIAHAERQAQNAPIQGSLADIIKAAMLAIRKDERLRKLGYCILIQVHDELVGEAPVETAEECKPIIEKHMKQAAINLGLDSLPFPADCGIGGSWYEAKNAA